MRPDIHGHTGQAGSPAAHSRDEEQADNAFAAGPAGQTGLDQPGQDTRPTKAIAVRNIFK